MNFSVDGRCVVECPVFPLTAGGAGAGAGGAGAGAAAA